MSYSRSIPRRERLGELALREQLAEQPEDADARRWEEFADAECREYDYVCKVEQLLQRFGDPHKSLWVNIRPWTYPQRQG